METRFLLPFTKEAFVDMIAKITAVGSLEAVLRPSFDEHPYNKYAWETGYVMSPQGCGTETRMDSEDIQGDGREPGTEVELYNLKVLEAFVGLSTGQMDPGFIEVKWSTGSPIPFETAMNYLRHWANRGYRGQVQYEAEGPGTHPEVRGKGKVIITPGSPGMSLATGKMMVYVQWTVKHQDFANQALQFQPESPAPQPAA